MWRFRRIERHKSATCGIAAPGWVAACTRPRWRHTWTICGVECAKCSTCGTPRRAAERLALCRRCRLDRKAGLDPVLDALAVLADVRVPELLQFARDLPAVRARGVRAVGHDRGGLVREQPGRLGLDVVGHEVHRARQVLLGPVALAKRVDDGDRAGLDLRPKLVAGDQLCHVALHSIRTRVRSAMSDNTGPQSAYSIEPGRPRPERADAARNRKRILDAAERLFAEHGVTNVSMDQIAAAAKVGKGTLFRRFGDKAGLAVALLDSRERDLQAAILSGPPPL